ncbi:hypothetical protein CYMTET_13512 [Cymbomonas tetramitiformis]|uniref:Uncharacterized protein n=1 Tax=Cymbomonas tetramitiformis TaxID=36881 RepID=A0AAE0GJH0_9CHLO|nr:hypothetical protein CYMTET_13512 [Cymbomonas tetramitiformis]
MMVSMQEQLAESRSVSRVVGTVDHEDFQLKPKNAQAVVQSVTKAFGVSKYSGNERNAFEAWTTFKTRLESAVRFYPELLLLIKEEVDVVSKRNLTSAFASAATTSWISELLEVPSLASDVLSAILTQVTVSAAFDLVRRCEGDGQKAYSKLRARVEPQLFGQLANSLSRLHKLRVNGTEDPVKQLGAFADLKTAITRYGGEPLDARTVEVMVLASAVDALPGSYAQVMTDLGRESKPTFETLLQRCEYHFVNALKERSEPQQGVAAATDEAVAAAHAFLLDRKRQAAEKKHNDEKKPVCVVCAGTGHATEACWLTNPSKLEDYVKRFPKEGARMRASAEERRQKLKVEDKVAAVVMTDDEVWNAELQEEVLIACSAVSVAATPCTTPFADEVESFLASDGASASSAVSSACGGASASSAVSSACDGASATSAVSSAASTVEVGAARRVLHYDSMATKHILNDVRFFVNGTVSADSARSFKVMAGQVTTSRGGGVGYVEVWNLVTKQTDKLLIEAQYVPDSPFNLISAVALEDSYNLYATLVERELRSMDGTARYELRREGKVYVLPEVYDSVSEAALPTVQENVVREGKVFVLPEVYDRLRDQKLYHEKRAAVKYCMYGKQLHEKNVTVVLDASRAVDIKEWLLQYDNRFTVSESDPGVYFIDIPNVLVAQLNFFIDDVECTTSSEEWRTSLLTAFNAKWSRS